MLRPFPPKGERGKQDSESCPEDNPAPEDCRMSASNAAPEVTVVGTIERFTFRNPESGWAVVRLRESGMTFSRLMSGERIRE